MMQIRNELSTMRWRSNGNWQADVVIRVPVGGYIHGGLCHSQNIEGFFAHLTGIKIAYPCNTSDAKVYIARHMHRDRKQIKITYCRLVKQI